MRFLIKNKGLELCNLVVKLQVYRFLMMQKCINFNNLNEELVFRKYRIISMDKMRGFDGFIVNTKSPFYGAYGDFGGFYAAISIIFCNILSRVSRHLLGIWVITLFSLSLLTKVVIKFPLFITYMWYTSLQVSTVLYQHVRVFMAGFLCDFGYWVLGVGCWVLGLCGHSA